MATPCAACHALVYGPRTMHSACERASSTRFVPVAVIRARAEYKVREAARIDADKQAPVKRRSTRHKATPPAPVVKVKAPRGKPGLLTTLRAMGCVQCPTCHHYMAPEHPATCQGDVLMLGYGDLDGFTVKLTHPNQLDNEARRLAHAIADRKGEVAA